MPDAPKIDVAAITRPRTEGVEIFLPEDTPRKPRRSIPEPTTFATVETVQQTLAEYMTSPQCGARGRNDLPCTRPAGHSTNEPHIAQLVTLAAVDEWRELWLRKPVALFGAFALRAALRRGFRDVIGDHHAPDEQHTEAPAEEADRG